MLKIAFIDDDQIFLNFLREHFCSKADYKGLIEFHFYDNPMVLFKGSISKIDILYTDYRFGDELTILDFEEHLRVISRVVVITGSILSEINHSRYFSGIIYKLTDNIYSIIEKDFLKHIKKQKLDLAN